MATDTAALVAIGILTVAPDSLLNRRMAESYALAPAADVLLRWCIFEDEAVKQRAPPPNQYPQIAVLTRPTYVSSLPQFQCVAKILAWLELAASSLAPKFVGWADSDLWMVPARLQTFFNGIVASVHSYSWSWVGNPMHWLRFDPQLLRGMGFMWGSSPSDERNAMELRMDERSHRARLKEHRAAVSMDLTARRRESFVMAQGSFSAFGIAAVGDLLGFVKHTDEAKVFLQPAVRAGLPTASHGKCTLPTDVGMGWLTTHAFNGSARIRFVQLVNLLELFVWPSSRFNINHSVAVHLANAKHGNFDETLGYYDARVRLPRAAVTASAKPGSVAQVAPLVPPRYTCAPTRWLHAATSTWLECVNVAQCGTWQPVLPGANVSLERWLPAPARMVCEQLLHSRREQSQQTIFHD